MKELVKRVLEINGADGHLPQAAEIYLKFDFCLRNMIIVVSC